MSSLSILLTELSQTCCMLPSSALIQCCALLADCVLSEWSSWSECSVSCGGGVSVRRKTILQNSEPGGAACLTPIEQHTACNTNSCLPGEKNVHRHMFIINIINAPFPLDFEQITRSVDVHTFIYINYFILVKVEVHKEPMPWTLCFLNTPRMGFQSIAVLNCLLYIKPN